jgi:hypothetical protein
VRPPTDPEVPLSVPLVVPDASRVTDRSGDERSVRDAPSSVPVEVDPADPVVEPTDFVVESTVPPTVWTVLSTVFFVASSGDVTVCVPPVEEPGFGELTVGVGTSEVLRFGVVPPSVRSGTSGAVVVGERFTVGPVGPVGTVRAAACEPSKQTATTKTVTAPQVRIRVRCDVTLRTSLSLRELTPTGILPVTYFLLDADRKH